MANSQINQLLQIVVLPVFHRYANITVEIRNFFVLHLYLTSPLRLFSNVDLAKKTSKIDLP